MAKSISTPSPSGEPQDGEAPAIVRTRSCASTRCRRISSAAVSASPSAIASSMLACSFHTPAAGTKRKTCPIPRRHAQSESKSEAVAAASSLAWRSAFLCVGIDASQKIELKVADDRRRHMLGVGLAEHQVRS